MWIYRRTDGRRTDGWTDGRTDGRMADGRTDGRRTDARTKKSPCRPRVRKTRRADFPREKIGVPTPLREKKSRFCLMFRRKTVFCDFCPVFEELGFFGRYWQIVHEISLRAI